MQRSDLRDAASLCGPGLPKLRQPTPPGEKGLLGARVFKGDAHVHLALLLRQIRGAPYDQPNVILSTRGAGLGLSGRLSAPWGDHRTQVTFSTYAGKGIGRYITDLGTLGGQDGVYDAATDTIQTLPVFAWYVGLERHWSKRFRSTATYGFVHVDNLEIQAADAFHTSNRCSINFTWSPIGQLDLVSEFLFGWRKNKDGQSGFSDQLQVGANFRF